MHTLTFPLTLILSQIVSSAYTHSLTFSGFLKHILTHSHSCNSYVECSIYFRLPLCVKMRIYDTTNTLLPIPLTTNTTSNFYRFSLLFPVILCNIVHACGMWHVASISFVYSNKIVYYV